MASYNDHVCGIDCEPIYNADRQQIIHLRYQVWIDTNMTRREFRATGQDATRNIRIWNAARRDRINGSAIT